MLEQGKNLPMTPFAALSSDSFRLNASRASWPLCTAIALVLCLFSFSSIAQANTGDPKRVIEERYQAFLDLVEQQVLTAELSDEEIYDLMEKELSPAVDFPRIARKVMGKYSRQASDDQLARFTELFKRSLVNTYSKGVDNIEQLDTVVIDDAVLDSKGRRAIVNSTVLMKNGQRYQVDYALFLKDKTQWLVENITVEGVNIGIVYRNQFSHYMEQYNDDVEQVLSNWGK